MSDDLLKGKKIAFLAADGFEQVELTEPWKAVGNAGAELHLVSLKEGEIFGVHHMEKGDDFKVDRCVSDVDASDYDGLVIPGGLLNPDTLRMDEQAVSFVRGFFDQKKPVSAICHGPWLLVEAGVVEGRTLTSWPSLKTDITNAGGRWVDEEVVVDNGLTTSRKPDDLGAFCRKTVEEFCEGRHQKQAA